MSRADPAPLLRRLAAQFAAAVAEGSDLRETTGFRVHLWPTPDPFYRNVAIPVDPRCMQTKSVGAMLRVFTAHGRSPSVEYFAELWPELAPALTLQGLALDIWGSVMAATPAPGYAPAPGSARLLTADDPLELLRDFLSGASTVFGQRAAQLAPGELQRLAAGLRRGTLLAAAVMRDEVPVAGASLIRAGAVAELAGVWTRPDRRRQGYAGACCQLLLRHFFGHTGELAWLSAHQPEAVGLYARLGFRALGTQLNFVGPASS